MRMTKHFLEKSLFDFFSCARENHLDWNRIGDLNTRLFISFKRELMGKKKDRMWKRE